GEGPGEAAHGMPAGGGDVALLDLPHGGHRQAGPPGELFLRQPGLVAQLAEPVFQGGLLGGFHHRCTWRLPFRSTRKWPPISGYLGTRLLSRIPLKGYPNFGTLGLHSSFFYSGESPP